MECVQKHRLSNLVFFQNVFLCFLTLAGAGWWHIFGFLNVEQLRAEVEAARGDFDREMTRENQNRLTARVEALLKVQRGEPDGIELEAA